MCRWQLPDLSKPALSELLQQYKSITAKIHYHIPIHQTQLPQAFLSSTQAAIVATLDFLTATPNCQPYLEIETYTWLNFIADNNQQTNTLHQGLVAEFTWLEAALLARNLLA